MAKLVTSTKCKGIVRPDCRVCLKKDGTLPIFGDESKPDISMEISTFGEIQLQENDEYPKYICQDCFKLLEGAISFRKSAKRSDAILRRKKRNKDTISSSQLCSTMKPEDVQIETIGKQSILAQSRKEDIEQFKYKMSMDQCETRINFVSVQMEERENEQVSQLKDENYVDIVDTVHENESTLENYGSGTIALNESENSSYSCKYCSQSFQSSNDYEEHRTTIEHKRNYVMSFLPRGKGKKCQVRQTKNTKDYMCEFCNQVFTRVDYSKHMLSEHNIKLDPNPKKQCTICNKMLHPAALGNHMKRIHDKGNIKPKVKLECPVCKKFFSKHFYPLHLQRHKQGDTRNFVCDQCGKKFFFKSSFFTHRLIHTNDLPHKCEYCPYRGRTKELLKIHVRTHTGDYPYQCTQCQTRCATKSNLNSHMRRHRGPVDFICDICSRGFYSKIQLERHISVTHYGVKNHICSTCGAAFGYRHGLMSHQRKVHKRPKGLGRPKAVYLQLEEKGLLPPETLHNEFMPSQHYQLSAS